MREHLAMVHPQQFAFIGERKMQSVIDLSGSNNTEEVYTRVVTDLVDKERDKEIKVKLWKEDASKLNCTVEKLAEEPADIKPFTILNCFSLSNEQS